MSRKKYPQVYVCKWRGNYPGRKAPECDAKDCKLIATKRIEIEVSYMRGDDIIYSACDAHSKLAKKPSLKEFWEIMPKEQ